MVDEKQINGKRNDLNDENYDGGWYVALCECRICTKQHISVFPVIMENVDYQECPHCGNMTAEPIEYYEPDQLTDVVDKSKALDSLYEQEGN
jgi:hypothetical protein